MNAKWVLVGIGVVVIAVLAIVFLGDTGVMHSVPIGNPAPWAS